MMKIQWIIVVLAVSLFATTAEARGRRMVWQQPAVQYAQPAAPTQYYAAPVQNYRVVAPAAAPLSEVPANYAVVSTNQIVQTSSVETSNGGIVQANVVMPAVTSPAPAMLPAPAAAAAGSAQWKAEQSARMGSVQHLGGGFGGGSFEGNGFGATPDQAVRNSCFWGQRTPIEIGVARGANGYYATIFYR